VLDKNFSNKIELIRRQYSGNAHGVIKGIGMVNCLYVNPESGQYWIIDYRLLEPEGDGKTKLDHVRDMLMATIARKQLPFQAVLMDTGYATRELMPQIESLRKIYYCPLRANRQVDDSGATQPYRRVDALQWSPAKYASGKIIKIKGFPGRAQGETISGCGISELHGLDRDERPGSRLIGCNTRSASPLMEDRAVSSRTQSAHQR